METKREVTVKFIAGVALIVVSLILGKLVLVPILLFPGSDAWRTWMIIVYVFSWVLLLVGVVLAGVEGFKLATHKYKEYKKKTIHTVKNHGKKAAHHTKKAAKKAAMNTKKAAKKAAKNTKKAAKKTVHVLKKSRKVMKKRPHM
jgi:uncharacterized protein YacL